ncbi:MAG: HdeD family acid-resistance protein [Syntrophothermus sp.]
MEKKINKNWLFLAINGVVAILFGCLLLFFSTELVQTILLVTSLVLLLAGIILFLISIRQLKKDKNVALLIIQSVSFVTLGLVLLILREKSTDILLIALGVWAIVVGIFQLVILVNLPKKIRGKNYLLFNAIFTMALGVFLIVRPFTNENRPVIIAVGVVSVFIGIGMIYLGILIRKVLMSTNVEMIPEGGKV